MMIPTRGASTSISSNASSTSGTVAVAGAPGSATPGSPPFSGSCISIRILPLSIGGDALDRSRRDVGAHLHAVEADPARRIVRPIAGVGWGRTQSGYVEHPAARGDDLAAALGGPRVQHLGNLRRLLEALDHVPFRGGFGVARGGEDDGDRPVGAELGLGAGEAAGLARGQ